MRRTHGVWFVAAACGILFAACSSGGGKSVPALQTEKVSPDSDVNAPGMIPVECESLLQKSQDWGYSPNERWKPRSDEQALEVAQFFSTFHFVPENTARYFNAWVTEPVSTTVAEAEKRTEAFALVQVCDAVMSMNFLESVMKHRWADGAKKSQAKAAVLKFLVNQQARISTLMPRAITVNLVAVAKDSGFVAGSSGPVKAIRAKMEKEIQANAKERAEMEAAKKDDALWREKMARKELAQAEKLREDLSRQLPLP